MAPRTTTLALLGAALAAAVASARPPRTPLARLEWPSPARPPARKVPTPAPLPLEGTLALGDFRLVVRPDGVVDGARASTLLAGDHGWRTRDGALIYHLDRHGEVEPVGVARLVELHPLGSGRDRGVWRVTLRTLSVRFHQDREGRSPPARLVWSPGYQPSEHRYFLARGNLTGMPYRDFERLVAGKVWVSMPAQLVRMAMGAPQAVEIIPSRRLRRQRWVYPRGPQHTTWIDMDDGQLRTWRDSWQGSHQRVPRPGPRIGRGMRWLPGEAQHP